MTRMFTGSRGDGAGGGTSNPIFDKYKKRSAKETFLNKMRGIDEAKMSEEEKYKKIFDEKLEELRQQALTGGRGSKYKFSLPGTEQAEGEEKELSKSMEAFLRRMAMKKVKEQKKKDQERAQIKVKAQYFTGIQGGRIDAKGRIYGPDNRWVASVNLKTGKVMSRSGMRICKYNAKSPYTFHLIAQYIAREYGPNKGSFMGGTNGYGTPASNAMYGPNSTADPNAGMGSFYGGGSAPQGGMGGFYGGGDDNKGGGFWG